MQLLFLLWVFVVKKIKLVGQLCLHSWRPANMIGSQLEPSLQYPKSMYLLGPVGEYPAAFMCTLYATLHFLNHKYAHTTRGLLIPQTTRLNPASTNSPACQLF